MEVIKYENFVCVMANEKERSNRYKPTTINDYKEFREKSMEFWQLKDKRIESLN